MSDPLALSDATNYIALQERQYRDWEAKCTSCGACCGIMDSDHCEHLVVLKSGQYACGIYEDRFGMHKTRSGKPFCCVPIREILHVSWPGDQCCGYKK